MSKAVEVRKIIQSQKLQGNTKMDVSNSSDGRHGDDEVLVGVDDGSSAFKVVYGDSNGNEVKLLVSAVVSGGALETDSAGRSVGVLFTDGEAFTVGPPVASVAAFNTANDGFHTSQAHRLLLANALSQVGVPVSKMAVGLGLPVGVAFDAAVKAQKTGNCAKDVYAGYEPRVLLERPFRLFHYAQSVGAYLSLLINPAGAENPALTGLSVAVVDIGSYTTDTVVVRNPGAGQSLILVKSLTQSAPVGVSIAVDELQAILVARFREAHKALTYERVAGALVTRTLKLFGKEHDVSSEVVAALETAFTRIKPSLTATIESAASADMVVPVGGGAVLFSEQLARLFPQNLAVHDDPLFANALGYYRFLRFAEPALATSRG